MLRYSFFAILLTFSLNVFALGGKGPLVMHKDAGLQNKKPIVLSKIGIDEHMGEKIDLNLMFKDESGQDIRLGTYFNDKPIFMILIYYECPTLCNLHLNALMQTFKKFEWSIGNEFDFIAVSIDPKETSEIASMKLDAYFNEYGKPETRKGWHFLTGNEENIKKLAAQVGFRYAWDPQQEQWAHPAAGYVLTPEGAISFYHYGLDVTQKTLRLSLVEASNNKIGTIIDRMVLFCLQYDPNKKTYSFYALNIMRVAGVFTLLILGFIMFKFWSKEKNNRK